MLPLLRRHHVEAGLEQQAVPFDPDWDRLFALDRAGIVGLTTARVDDLLVGYALSVVTKPLWHAGTLAAHIEGVYLDPLYRQGLTGYRLLKEHVSSLRQSGVRVIKSEAPDRIDHGRLAILLRRLGMKPIERVYYMLLEAS